MSIYAEIADAKSKNREFTVVTVVETSGSTAREPGAMMICYPDGSISGTVGGGTVEQQAIVDALAALHSGTSMLRQYEIVAGGPKGDTLAGTVRCFLQPHRVSERLFLFGAGHVAQELVPLAKLCGFYVTVIDPRKALANTRGAEAADAFLLEDYSVMDTMAFDRDCYIMIGTYDHGIDGELLGKALNTDAGYVGMLGGKPKIRAIFQRLEAAGMPRARLLKAHTPAGLDIGGSSPAQIALSIAAELMAVREGRDGGFSSAKRVESEFF